MKHLAALLLTWLIITPAVAADPISFDPRWLDDLAARPIGPANMGGRVVGVAVVDSRPTTMYVATATGGLWKTINNGTTWTPRFDQQDTVALGAVAVAPSDPDIVWVGTGEANARNSVSWGDGVYKSTDGGTTWRNMGLKDTAHIGRIVIHPQDPNIVYVAALGHLWGPNPERGLYKTTDGGQHWRQVNSLGDETGFIDLIMDPSEPDTLYAAAYRCRRSAFSGGNPAVQFSVHAGLYRSLDAGESWDKLTNGLPDRPLGRCGIDIYRKDPRILYAVIQTDRTDIRVVAGQAARTGSRVETGGIFRSEDKGRTWTKLNDLCPRPFYFGQIRVDPSDGQRIYVLGIPLFVSRDGGKTFRTDGARGVHADHHALWIDPQDSSHLVLGCDGGVYFSYDRGASWEHVNNMALGQFYAVGVDMRKPYWVYGGLQDNGSWGGPSATRSLEGITPADWARVIGADGFYCQIDPTDPNTVYAEGQYGRLQRIDVRTGRVAAIRPSPARNAPAYRFNWNSPLLLSAHNPRTLYYGGNHLFRSVDRGDHWEVLSPDLTHGKPGPDSSQGHTLTAIAESPLKPGLLFVGSDDGRVHVTRNGGGAWTDLSDKLPGVPPERSISRIECSRFAEGTVYLTLDRHRNDDRAPYVFRSTDYGASWQALAHNLPPQGPVHVIREDLRNQDLLFVGTEFGLFASLDAGASWHRLRNGLPTVPVHDLVIHPRDRELVIATHGRSIYILDIAPLEEMTSAVCAEAVHLYDVKPATTFFYRGSHGRGARTYAAPNPSFGATIYYSVKEAVPEGVRISISDVLGNTLAELRGSKEAGLHHLTWNLRKSERGRTRQPGPLVAAGDYVVKLTVGERVLTKRLRVEAEE